MNRRQDIYTYIYIYIYILTTHVTTFVLQMKGWYDLWLTMTSRMIVLTLVF